MVTVDGPNTIVGCGYINRPVLGIKSDNFIRNGLLIITSVTHDGLQEVKMTNMCLGRTGIEKNWGNQYLNPISCEIRKFIYENEIFSPGKEGGLMTTILYRRCPAPQRTMSKVIKRILFANYVANQFIASEYGFLCTMNYHQDSGVLTQAYSFTSAPGVGGFHKLIEEREKNGPIIGLAVTKKGDSPLLAQCQFSMGMISFPAIKI